MAPFTFWHGLTLIPASMENYWCTVSCLRWNYLSIPNFSGATIEVWKWMHYLISQFLVMWVLSMFGLKSVRVFKRVPMWWYHIYLCFCFNIYQPSLLSAKATLRIILTLYERSFCRKSFLDIDIAQVVEPLPHRRHRLPNLCLLFICHVYISLILRQLIYQAHI